MAKRDTRRTAHYSVKTQNWSLDKNPHKSTKKAKAKERQEGRKLSQPESWYCGNCAVEVYERRCKHCGKLERDKS